LSSEQCRIEFNLQILKVFELNMTLAVIHWLYISFSLDFLGAAQAKVHSETHFCFPESFAFLLSNWTRTSRGV